MIAVFEKNKKTKKVSLCCGDGWVGILFLAYKRVFWGFWAFMGMGTGALGLDSNGVISNWDGWDLEGLYPQGRT
jgi:hypothetical protein